MRTSPSWSLGLLLLASCLDASAREPAPAAPRAWVLAPDPAASEAWLARAGFDVEPLPLDRPPHALTGLLVFGAEASDMPEYHAYMRAHADELPAFVARGGVVLQLAQSPEAEPAPPFLPPALSARRGPAATHPGLTFTADPLIAGLERPDAWHADTDAGWIAHAGFTAPVRHADGAALLLAGRHGRGSYVLTALPLDRPLDEGTRHAPLADEFAANLARLQAHAAPP